MGTNIKIKKLSKKILESEKSIIKFKFKFNIGDKVIYLGGMHKAYQNCVCTIKDKSNKGNRIEYVVQFEDGLIRKYTLESTLELFVNENINNIKK